MDQVLPGYAEVCILFRLTDFIFYSSIKAFKSKALSYRNQATDLQCKSMYWFLYDGDICLKLVRLKILSFSQLWVTCRVFLVKCYWKWIFLVSFREHISETNGAINPVTLQNLLIVWFFSHVMLYEHAVLISRADNKIT